MNKLKRTKTEKGITLIALIITIIVLLILAVVAIRAVTDDGIIQHAKNAQTQYQREQALEEINLELNEWEILKRTQEEQDLKTFLEERFGNVGEVDGNYIVTVKGFEATINSEGKLVGDIKDSGGNADTIPTITIAEAMEDAMLTATTNSITYDKFNNKIVVPAGFKILVDDTTTYTQEDINVTKGIVVTDGTNQFVWVPVGKIYTDEKRTEENAKTITLGRYSSFSANEDGEYVPAQTAENYMTAITIEGCTEDTKENHNSEYINAIAKNIKDFCLNSVECGGYYLGRYEAGKAGEGDNIQVVCKPGSGHWRISQQQASSLCQSMYTNKTFESDLINSYAWDTAIVFIQTFSNSSYASASNYWNDIQCNINDMSCCCREWSTETYNNSEYPDVWRGGFYYSGMDSQEYGYTADRYPAWKYNGSYADYDYSFRPLIYLSK